MANFADLLINGDFAIDVATYDDYYPGDEDNARIVLIASVEGKVNTEVIVDTGAPWCVLDPQIVDLVNPPSKAIYTPFRRLRIRGVSYAGSLRRMLITLWGEQRNQGLEVEATVFVPELQPDETWPYPNFLGLSGFLERVRFAIDPSENTFYFGPL